MDMLIALEKNTYYIEGLTKIGIYKLNSADVCLIDSGNNKESARQINVILKKNNFNVKYIINTHAHADHIGGNHYFQKKYNSIILSSEQESVFIENPILMPAVIYGAKPFDYLLNDHLYAEASKVNVITAKNMPKGLKIINLPGHSINMIGVVTDDNICFLGDALVSNYLLNKYKSFFMYVYDIEKYLQTLEYLKTLKYDKYILSHGEELESLDDLIELNKIRIKEMEEAIINICSEKINFESLLQKIFNTFEIKMNLLQYHLIGTTTKSFISYLVNNNKLEIIIEDNMFYYQTKR